MGHWQDKNAEWYDQTMTYCGCCGLVIPTKYWAAEVAGEKHIFCSPACERLYRDYCLKAIEDAASKTRATN